MRADRQPHLLCWDDAVSSGCLAAAAACSACTMHVKASENSLSRPAACEPMPCKQEQRVASAEMLFIAPGRCDWTHTHRASPCAHLLPVDAEQGQQALGTSIAFLQGKGRHTLVVWLWLRPAGLWHQCCCSLQFCERPGADLELLQQLAPWLLLLLWCCSR